MTITPPRLPLFVAIVTLIALTAACGGSKTATPALTVAASATRTGGGATTTAPAPATSAVTPAVSMTLASDAFANNATIPTQYTCAGASLQPPLTWTGTPSATKAFALLMEDTDVPGVFDHWIVYDLPSSVTSLPSQASSAGDLAGGKQGKTARGSAGYIGPCPPNGAPPHHYRFRIYSLDAPAGLPADATKSEVLAAMQGHILAQGELVGLFSR